MKPIYKHSAIFLTVLTITLLVAAEALCQLEWTKYEGNPVMVSDQSSWEGDGVVASSIIYDGTVYKMWYNGAVNVASQGGYATSVDGVHWDKHSGNPIFTIGTGGAWDQGMVGINSIVFDGNSYHMWYAGIKWGAKQCIGYATSSDGIAWEKYQGNPVLTPGPAGSWDGGHLFMCRVIKIDSVFHMWYSGCEDDRAIWRIGYATSNNGIEWTKHNDQPVLELGEPGSWDAAGHHMPDAILKDGFTLRMYYSASDGTNNRIGLAESEDGVNWIKYEGNPILDIGPQDAWDRESVYAGPILLFNGSNYSMYYTGSIGSPNFSIGLATSTPLQHDLKVISSPAHLSSVPIIINEGITPQVKINNIGITDELNVSVTCVIDSVGINVYSNTQTIDTLMSQEMKLTEINFDNWIRKDTSQAIFNISYFTQLSNDENKSNDTLKTMIAFTNLIDNFELGFTNWHSDTCWGLTGASYSGTYSLCNTTTGNYENNMDSWVEYNYSFDLSRLNAAHISYWTRHFIQPDKDFGYVEVSSDGGGTWNQLGDAYTGFKATWEQHGRSLTDCCRQGFNDVRFRFRFVSDESMGSAGWFIDDVAIYPYELQTSVSQSIEKQLPQKYALLDNYPNPFNPNTSISYEIPKNSQVLLKIFNLLGQEIRTLVNENKQAGHHTVHWDGKDNFGKKAVSGVYLYHIKVGNFKCTKKMLLLE